MILVTGGLGFIGSHTTRALVELGEDCVVTQYRTLRVPTFLKDGVGDRILIYAVNLMDEAALLAIGEAHEITGIVHLAAPRFGGRFVGDVRIHMTALANVLMAAEEWDVQRVTVASALGVYAGIDERPWREDRPLPLSAPHPIVALKKCSEVISDLVSRQGRIECAVLRIGGVFGPLQSPVITVPARLTHAAVNGVEADLAGSYFSVYANDGYDHCYVKDLAHGLALLQTAETLNHNVYNVGSGKPTSNQEIAAAVKSIVPDAQVELPSGSDPNGPGFVPYLDITAIQQDTGYEPRFEIEAAIADYVAWLRAGNVQ